MLDLVSILLFLIFGSIFTIIIIEVFKWGYNKEKRGERTDLYGKPNNRMSKDEMD
jgi:hypothetical protein